MPFVTKNPSYYFSALEEETTEPLHIGLYLAGSIDEKRAHDFVTLGKAIHQTSRSIRCLWLRFREGDESLIAAFTAFGEELFGATAIQSLVFEGRVGTAEVQCLSDFFTKNDLRGIQFRRTDVDMSTFTILKPFFSHTTTLKVLDMSSNSRVGDECINKVLDALLEGEARLETLNIGENNLDGQPDENIRVSSSEVASIASFVSKTPSLSSITLRLRHMDDVGIGEIAMVVKRTDCNVRRLDLSGNFGNSGVKIFAEALKTNISLRTVSFGCYKNLDDIGGQVLLNVVDPFSQPTVSSEWEHVTRSNHTLQSIYILDRPTVSVDNNIITKLQSISNMDPHRTLQSKCWRHIEKNIEDISHLELESKHMPEVLAFVQQHGTVDHIFRLVKSRNTPELFTNPSPEKARMSHQVEKVESENEMLKELLESEREKSEDLHEENNYLRNLFRDREERKQCCMLPVFKFMELWKYFIELIREPTLS
mmetsp:Transcript_10693/g.23672  ORF Transcript_10693/g.23672 Transcript_10693/m.23672 type:complete len:480 (-) Transcript_10693:32-1471(-)